VSDPNVDRWHQRGQFCVWKHKQRTLDWNFAADDVACGALLELLDLLENSKWGCRKAVNLIKARRTATGAPEHRAVFAKQLIIKYRGCGVPDDFWSLEENGPAVTLVVGRSQLKRLREAVSDMKNGGEDYCIGSDEGPLWVWWFVREENR
jgi:hypothetical protein